MNKHKYKLKVQELEFALAEKIKEFDYQKGEFGRLKAAYKMSKKQIRELQQECKKNVNSDEVSLCYCSQGDFDFNEVKQELICGCGRRIKITN